MKSFRIAHIVKESFALFPAFFKELLQVVISPRQGWHDTEKAGLPVHTLLTQGYIPFIAIAALSAFMPLAYRSSSTATACLLEAISIFIRYFIGYFAATYILGFTLRRIMGADEAPSAEKNDRMVLYTLATLALLSLVSNICPVELALLQMLPLYVVYIVWEASWHMLVPADKRLQFLGATVISCVTPLFLVHLFFALLNQ